MATTTTRQTERKKTEKETRTLAPINWSSHLPKTMALLCTSSQSLTVSFLIWFAFTTDHVVVGESSFVNFQIVSLLAMIEWERTPLPFLLFSYFVILFFFENESNRIFHETFGRLGCYLTEKRLAVSVDEELVNDWNSSREGLLAVDLTFETKADCVFSSVLIRPNNKWRMCHGSYELWLDVRRHELFCFPTRSVCPDAL